MSRPVAAAVPPLPAIVETNVRRWEADDDGWRGYHRSGDRIVPDARVECGLRLVLPNAGCTYLDIGCANGVLTRLYAERARAAKVVGVDFVDMGLASDIAFRRANLDTDEPLPFDDDSFDVVTCMETLEHLHDTDHILSEIRRVLRPSGYAIVAVPRLDALLTIAMLAVGYQPPAIECSLRARYGSPDSSSRVSGHVSHFTRRALVACVRANGFVVDEWGQASIYRAWRFASGRTPPLWQRLPMFLVSQVPFKQDDILARIRPVQSLAKEPK